MDIKLLSEPNIIFGERYAEFVKNIELIRKDRTEVSKRYQEAKKNYETEQKEFFLKCDEFNRKAKSIVSEFEVWLYNYFSDCGDG